MSNINVIETIKSKINENIEEDSFLVIDLADVRKKLDAWKQCLPRVEPFYAVKCNDHVEILREMAHLGLSFDCASYGEIRKVLDLGVPASKIIYANPCKQVSHLAAAEKVGVTMMTFDNQDELKKIRKECPHAVVVLRLATDDSKAVCRLSQKFGAQLDQVPFLLQKVKDSGLNFGGFSYHVGSGCSDEDSFVTAVHNARKAFDIAESMDMHPKLLDIGGGFAGDIIHECDIKRAEFRQEQESNYEDGNKRIKSVLLSEQENGDLPTGNSDSDLEAGDELYHYPEKMPFPEVARLINKALDLYFPPSSGYRIIAEPGRYFVHSCGTLAATIIARRMPDKKYLESDEVEADKHMRYYINEGVYGAFSNTIYDHAHIVPNVLDLGCGGKVKEGAGVYDSSLWGPSCDGLDCVVKSMDLPKLKVGSWLYFENMGAYTICAGSNFNGFKKPNVYAINGTAPAPENKE